jgi:hypothetical protein
MPDAFKMRGEDMSKICPETNDTVLSQDCVECETKLCRTKTQPPDNMINMDKKSNGTVKNTGKPELRL